MTDLTAFIRTIKTYPDEFTPIGAAADYLDETSTELGDLVRILIDRWQAAVATSIHFQRVLEGMLEVSGRNRPVDQVAIIEAPDDCGDRVVYVKRIEQRTVRRTTETISPSDHTVQHRTALFQELVIPYAPGNGLSPELYANRIAESVRNMILHRGQGQSLLNRGRE